MKKIALIFTCILFILTTGCKTSDQVIFANDDIKRKISKDIDELFTEITSLIKDKDIEKYLELCIPGTENINEVYFAEFINNEQLYNDFFLEKNYQNLSKYYINDISRFDETAEYASEGYEFFIPESENIGERYIYIAEGTYNEFDIVLTAIFKKDDSKWKIEKFLLGDIRPYRLSITSLIDKALTLRNEGNLISAYMYNDLAGQFAFPSPYVRYVKQGEISNEMLEIAEELNSILTFPLDINTDDGDIRLYAVTSHKYSDGFYCRISYVTNLDIKDANEETILEEAKVLHEFAKKELIGLGVGFDNKLLYTAYFEEPITKGKEYESITVLLED